jgi:hypothetical protein
MRPKPNFPPLTDEQRNLVERHAKLASSMAYRKMKGLLLDYNVSLILQLPIILHPEYTNDTT